MYGSLINSIYDQSKSTEPEVGQGATILMWSDRHAGTIVEVVRFKTGKRAGKVKSVTVQQDKAIRVDNLGMSDAQSYRYERDENGRLWVFKTDMQGRFHGLLIGHRDEHYDYSF